MADAARVRDIVDLAPRWTGADAIRLNQMFRGRDSAEMLHALFTDAMLGPTALVSSFGAESAVLLHLVGKIRPDVPVIFLDTGKHFPETIAYRDALARQIGLTNIINVTPDPLDIAARDANGLRWSYDPDGCCALRKVAPLAKALLPYDAHISGRKAFQSSSRANLPRFEVDGDGRMKVNPLVDWDKAALDAYAAAHTLPPHPLVAQGYLSIGCAPCTSIVKPGEDPRSGRWAGWDKVECGIHTPIDGDDGTNDPVF
ncbi:MAG: phosphoadenylyl-sulfate reductase [Sphingomonadaceae bacterium]|nr:phosphoadenylyl-sulfate reductase [Sphingomonadaceae bacterium]